MTTQTPTMSRDCVRTIAAQLMAWEDYYSYSMWRATSRTHYCAIGHCLDSFAEDMVLVVGSPIPWCGMWCSACHIVRIFGSSHCHEPVMISLIPKSMILKLLFVGGTVSYNICVYKLTKPPRDADYPSSLEGRQALYSVYHGRHELDHVRIVVDGLTTILSVPNLLQYNLLLRLYNNGTFKVDISLGMEDSACIGYRDIVGNKHIDKYDRVVPWLGLAAYVNTECRT